MPTRCKICNNDIDSRDMIYCRYCKTPYHLNCIKSHLYDDKSCPTCKRMTSIAHYRRGVPDGVKPLQAMQAGKYTSKAMPADARENKKTGASKMPPIEKKGKVAQGGGRALLIINFIIIALLLASTHYAHTTYVEYEPGLFADENLKTVIPGQPAEFMFSLYNPGNILSRYRIYIDDDSVEAPTGWQIALLDDEGAFENNYIEKPINPGEEYLFKAKVYTSSGVDAGTQGSFRIIAITKDGKYHSSEMLKVVTQTQYIHNYELIQENTQKYVSAGETAQFGATIRNNGSGTDTYHIIIDSITPGWGASLIQEQMTIGANLSEQLALTMTAPNGAKGNQTGDAVIRVSSQNDPENIKTVKYTLVVNPSFAFDVTDIENEKEVLPGMTSIFTFKLMNTGNLIDTYDLIPSASLPPGWEYSVTRETVTLESGEQVTIGASILVSENSAGELEGTLDIALRSRGSSEEEIINLSVTTYKEQEKHIMVELFTSVNCGYCPAAEKAIEDVIGDYPGRVIVLEHHLNDSLASEISSQRGMKYTIGGYPIAIFDGTKKDSGGTTETYGHYVRIIGQLINEEPQVMINLSVSESTSNPGMSTVSAIIMPNGLGSNVPLDVFFVTYQNGVSPEGHWSKIYDYVSTEGFKRNISSLENIQTISMTMDIPEDGGVVVFVQDSSTNKIYQSVMI